MLPTSPLATAAQMPVPGRPSPRQIADQLGYTSHWEWSWDNYKAMILELARQHGLKPVSYTHLVNESQAEWLIAQVDNATTLPSFALLINVLAEAHRVPLWFLSAVKSRASRWPGLAAAVSAAVDHAANSVQAA